MRLEKKTREEEGKVGVGGRAANLEWRWEEFISAPPFFPPLVSDRHSSSSKLNTTINTTKYLGFLHVYLIRPFITYLLRPFHSPTS